MSLILDAGALVALERGDRVMWRRLKAHADVRTHGGVVAQVWRGGTGRQVPLARALAGIDVVPLDVVLGRRAGVLLGRTRQHDAIDAAVVCIADDDDVIVTSDPDDLAALADALGRAVDVVTV